MRRIIVLPYLVIFIPGQWMEVKIWRNIKFRWIETQTELPSLLSYATSRLCLLMRARNSVRLFPWPLADTWRARIVTWAYTKPVNQWSKNTVQSFLHFLPKLWLPVVITFSPFSCTNIKLLLTLVQFHWSHIFNQFGEFCLWLKPSYKIIVFRNVNFIATRANNIMW